MTSFACSQLLSNFKESCDNVQMCESTLWSHDMVSTLHIFSLFLVGNDVDCTCIQSDYLVDNGSALMSYYLCVIVFSRPKRMQLDNEIIRSAVYIKNWNLLYLNIGNLVKYTDKRLKLNSYVFITKCTYRVHNYNTQNFSLLS